MSYYQSLCAKCQCDGRPIPILAQLFCTVSSRWMINSKCLFHFSMMDGQFHLLFNPLLWTWSLWWAINWCSYLFISPGWMIPLLPRLFMLNDEFSIWTIKSICFFLMDDQATSEVSPSLFKFPFLSSGPTSSTALGKDSLVWIPVILCPSLSLLPHSFFVHPTCKSCSVVSTSSHLTPQPKTRQSSRHFHPNLKPMR